VVAPDGREAEQEDEVLQKLDENFKGQQREEELFSKLKKCLEELRVLLHIPFPFLLSISSTLYARGFCTNVISTACLSYIYVEKAAETTFV